MYSNYNDIKLEEARRADGTIGANAGLLDNGPLLSYPAPYKCPKTGLSVTQMYSNYNDMKEDSPQSYSPPPTRIRWMLPT